MSLRARHDKHGEIPGISQPSTCSHLCDGENKCGKEAHVIVSGEVEVMGKLLKIKKLICTDCRDELGIEVPPVSIGESNEQAQA
jgi:hypothetical protein